MLHSNQFHSPAARAAEEDRQHRVREGFRTLDSWHDSAHIQSSQRLCCEYCSAIVYDWRIHRERCKP